MMRQRELPVLPPPRQTRPGPLRERQVHFDHVWARPKARRYAVGVENSGERLAEPVFPESHALPRAAEPGNDGGFDQPLEINRRVVIIATERQKSSHQVFGRHGETRPVEDARGLKLHHPLDVRIACEQ